MISDLARAFEHAARSLQAWSNNSRRAGIGLAADRGGLDPRGGRWLGARGSGALGQLARLSFPIGIGAQGVLLEKGYDAVRISGSGELPPDGDGPVEAIDEDRLGTLGRATLRTLTALDQGPRPQHGPESYVQAVSQVMPGWVLALLAGTLLLSGAGGLGGRVRAGAAPAGGRAALAALGGRLGRAVPGRRSRLRELLALVGRNARAASGAGAAGRAPAGRSRACCAGGSGSRPWCSRTSSPAGSRSGRTRSCVSRSSRGPGWRSRSR